MGEIFNYNQHLKVPDEGSIYFVTAGVCLFSVIVGYLRNLRQVLNLRPVLTIVSLRSADWLDRLSLVEKNKHISMQENLSFWRERGT